MERLLARTFLLLLVLTAGLLGVEFLGRFAWGPAKAPVEAAYPAGFLRQPRPYVMFGGGSGHGLNERGYRGAVPRTPKPPGEYRVMLLGGSTVFEGDPTIAELMEQEFHTAGYSNARVYNCGVVSSVSGQELARIVFELADDQPDLIVMYNGGNDVLEPMHYDPRPGYPFNFLLYEHNPVLAGNDRSYPLLPLVAYASHVCRRLADWRFAEAFGKLQELRAQAGWSSPNWEENIASTYVRNLRKAARVSEAFGARFIAFFQPTLAFKDILAAAESERARKDAWEVAVSLSIRDRIQRLLQSGDADEVKCIDLSDIYDDVSELVFRDFIHTVQSAKPRVARGMVDHILGEVRRDGKVAERFQSVAQR